MITEENYNDGEEKDNDDEDDVVKSRSKWPEIHKQALKDFKLCLDAEADNRKLALDDLKFARLGEQWPDKVVKKMAVKTNPQSKFTLLIMTQT